MNLSLPKSSEFLDTKLLSRLPSLELKAKFLVAGLLTGIHNSPFRGTSVEFKEYREYQPGDSLKLIDWKAFAKTDNLYVRLQEAQTNMAAYLLLDITKSMNYKSEKADMSKWEYVQSLTAAMLLFLNKQGDAASLSFIGNSLADFTKPGSKKSHYHQLMVNLHRNANETAADICRSLSEISGLIKQRSMVLIFSDFYSDMRGLSDVINRLKYKKAEVLFFHVLDPMELMLDYDESVMLKDLETEEKMTLSPDLILKDYHNALSKHINYIADSVKKCGGDYIQLKTDVSPVLALGSYLSKRGGML